MNSSSFLLSSFPAFLISLQINTVKATPLSPTLLKGGLNPIRVSSVFHPWLIFDFKD